MTHQMAHDVPSNSTPHEVNDYDRQQGDPTGARSRSALTDRQHVPPHAALHSRDDRAEFLHTRRVLHRPHPPSWIATAIILLLFAMFMHALVANKKLNWGIVWHYFSSDEILRGLANTLWLTAASMLLAILIGISLAAMRLSSNYVLASVSWLFIWVFRSVPPLVQIIFWYNLGFLFTDLSLGIPFGPEFVSAPTNQVIGVYVAAILGLTFNASAYMGEIVRGGILGIDYGQTEAAMSLGMTPTVRFIRIILPQAMRSILPPTGNQTINMLKTTSLVSVVALPDLLYSAQTIYAQNYQIIPLLTVASLWYLIVSSLLSVGQYFIERHYGISKKTLRRPRLALNWVNKK